MIIKRKLLWREFSCSQCWIYLYHFRVSSSAFEDLKLQRNKVNIKKFVFQCQAKKLAFFLMALEVHVSLLLLYTFCSLGSILWCLFFRWLFVRWCLLFRLFPTFRLKLNFLLPLLFCALAFCETFGQLASQLSTKFIFPFTKKTRDLS